MKMSQQAAPNKSQIEEAPAVRPYGNVDELLEAAFGLLCLRRDLQEQKDAGTLSASQASRTNRQWTESWHRSICASTSQNALTRAFHTKRLNRFERETLAALLLERLGMITWTKIRHTTDLIELLAPESNRQIKYMRMLSEESRLYSAGLIDYEDDDEDLCERTILVDPILTESVLSNKDGTPKGWPLKSEKQLHHRLSSITRVLQKKSDALDDIVRGVGNKSDFYRARRTAHHLIKDVLGPTLKSHPDWKLPSFLAHPAVDVHVHSSETVILLALIGKALGHINEGDTLFSGAGLARAACRKQELYRRELYRLRPGYRLVDNGIIQPSDGESIHLFDSLEDIQRAEFELTEKSLELLGIKRQSVRKANAEKLVRSPKVRLQQLVLSNKTRQAVDMVISQALHRDVMLNDWGIGERIAYGKAMTVLFGGPPGVGKTACAEAVAHELGSPILVADYSSIQNCFVGQTEKNIVKTFNDAKQSGAVLFWDEADAMFYDRDSAGQNWEVRDVNILLQEIERFEGVCILSTNRKINLDKALERRIAIKVEFEVPDGKMRQKIWRKLLPKKMPLTNDVHVETLGKVRLTGGEIKNVILNAARLSLCRGAKSRVSMEDFNRAIDMETENRWSEGETSERMGFLQDSRQPA